MKKFDAGKHGYTRGCGGCSSWHRGLARQPHTEECRRRFQELLKGEARVINAQGRKADFEQRELEKKQKKDEKKEKRRLEEDEPDSKRPHLNPGGESSGSRPDKRKAEDYQEGEEKRIEVIEECQVDRWVCEITERIKEEKINQEVCEDEEIGWDDVKDQELNAEEVRSARKEEVGYMEGRNIWTIKPVAECWEKLGRAPVSVRWVDTLKSDGVRSRLVARAYKNKKAKGEEGGRERKTACSHPGRHWRR